MLICVYQLVYETSCNFSTIDLFDTVKILRCRNIEPVFIEVLHLCRYQIKIPNLGRYGVFRNETKIFLKFSLFYLEKEVYSQKAKKKQFIANLRNNVLFSKRMHWFFSSNF